MEFTPLPSVFCYLLITLIFLQLGPVVLRRSILALSFILWVGAKFFFLMLWWIWRSKLSLLLFKFLLDLNNISISCVQWWDVQYLHLFRCIYENYRNTLAPDVTWSLWYPTWWVGYGIYLWTLALSSFFPIAMWSISCIGHHSFQKCSIVP